MTTAGWNADFLDMLEALRAAGVRFMVVGAHALAVHGDVQWLQARLRDDGA